jgi:RNA polymerase sigma factor (sigma-70 family)
MTSDDMALVREFAASRSEPAFAALVKRHIGLVHSAAMRQVGDAHLAEEIAQAVFIILARKAPSLGPKTVLSVWLYRTTRYAAADALKINRRRQAREQEAYMQSTLNEPEADAWGQVAPLLDDAMSQLGETDRAALVLRFFENKAVAEVAAALRVNESAAQRRVLRAVEKLRSWFTRRGVVVPAAALTAAISANSVQAVPAGMAVAISATAVKGAAVAASVTTLVNGTIKTIFMTTIQKSVIAVAIVAAAGTGIYEAHQASTLQTQIQALQQQVQDLSQENQRLSALADAQKSDEPQIAQAVAPVPASGASQWSLRLQALNGSDWRRAFAVGGELAALPPDEGFAILRTNWASITNASARQQLLKAFDMAQHERLPAVLELALLDPSTEVQSWSLTYLKEVALQDFSSNYAGAADWLSARRDMSLSAAVGDAVWQAANTLRTGDGDQIRAQLDLLKHAGQLLAKHPDVVGASGLGQMFAQLAGGSDTGLATLALETASHMPLGDEWRREVALPRLTSANPWSVREAAASVLGGREREWAVQPLLETLADGVNASEGHSTFRIAQALAEVGSPKAIPTMIALIEAGNSYDTIYGIGYFGLSKMTGVNYDEKHDGAWWRQWWESNKRRFPADVQALEIPQLSQLKKGGTTGTP